MPGEEPNRKRRGCLTVRVSLEVSEWVQAVILPQMKPVAMVRILFRQFSSVAVLALGIVYETTQSAASDRQYILQKFGVFFRKWKFTG